MAPTTKTLGAASLKSIKDVKADAGLVNVFTILGYEHMAGDPDAHDSRTKCLFNVLYHLKVGEYKKLYIGMALSHMLNHTWFDTRHYLEAATSVLTAANFFIMNERSRDRVDPRNATLEEVRNGWMNPRYGGTESTTCSVKCNDLPELPSSDSRLLWFTWKDAAVTQLEIGGLAKCAKDRSYAESHPRQNAALNGLIKRAILKQTKHTNLAILADDTITDGDGHARWAKLVQLNEHSSLIRIILRDLISNFQKLKLKDVHDYDSFGGSFMQLKNRIVYMVEKGTSSAVPDLSEFIINNWKERFCDKIVVPELNAVTMKCRDGPMDLWETYLTIKAHIIDKDLVTRPSKDRVPKNTGKSKQSERGGSGNDDAESTRAAAGNHGPPDVHHKRVIDQVFSSLGTNTEMSDDTKREIKKAFKDAREHVKVGKSSGKSSGGKPPKKNRRRKKSHSTSDTVSKRQRTRKNDKLPGSDEGEQAVAGSDSDTYLDDLAETWDE
jgi:hypothetical protein